MFQDKLRISQIIINFLSNAFKFTLTGNIFVIAEYIRINNNCKITVKDSGIGISK
jgi:two-component system, OmpR family, phosphate regulon sensor histidine kinase PhoR